MPISMTQMIFFPIKLAEQGIKPVTYLFSSPGSVFTNHSSELSNSLQIFLYLEACECNTTSDWLNHMV